MHDSSAPDGGRHEVFEPIEDRAIGQAREEGRQAGRNAASWVLDGNATQEHVTRMIAMLENGDPEAFVYLPTLPNLSGEFAGDPTQRTVAEQVTGMIATDIDPDLVDAIATAWEEGVAETFEQECERLLRAALDTYTTQEGAVFGMEGATCPNGHESNLDQRTFPSGYFRCPTCEIVYDEPTFDPAQFITGGD